MNMKTIMTITLLCAIAQGAWAEAQYISGDNGPMWEYDEGSETLAGSLIYSVDTDQGVAHVTGITGDNPTGVLIIPATYNYQGADYPVTTIASEAFKDKTGLTSVSFPYVSVIAANAFEGCTGLTTLNLPSTLTSVGNEAFKGCTGLRSVVIDANFGGSLFAGCDNISAITFGDHVTSIGASAFQNLPGLTSVTIPANVTTIGGEAFDYCANLSLITFLGETPPETNGGTQLYGIASNYVMRVPTGSVDAYRAHTIWGNGSKADHIECMLWKGSGTESDPYLISHKDELDLLAKRTGEGYSYEGMFFKLTADICYTTDYPTLSVTPIGTAQTPFAGTLDGDGHKVTVQFGSSDSNATNQYQALFSYVKGAKFRKLTVDGNIYAGAKFAGGLVGHSQGWCSFTDCHVSVAIASSVEGDGMHGGFVAHHDNGGDESGLTFTNCIFDGKMLGTTTTNCGGFVGYARFGAPTTSTDCLFAPAECTIGIARSATFMRYDYRDPQFVKAYYTAPLEICQGNRVYTEVPADEIYSMVTAAGNQPCYAPLVVHYSQDYYERGTVNDLLEFTVSTADGITLVQDEDYTPVLPVENVSDAVTFTDEGTFALPLILTAVDGGRCVGSHTYDVMVYSNWPGKGMGTETDPYLVESASDLNRLMELIRKRQNPLTHNYSHAEYEFAGKYFRQTADIDYTNEPKDDRGCNYLTNDGAYSFCGTYDGDGHTVSGIVAKPLKYDALGVFGRVSEGGCIKNLTVSNCTFTSDCTIIPDYVATGAVVGWLSGSRIENCHATNSVYILAGGKAYNHGGIVGLLSENSTVEGCTSAAHVRMVDGVEPAYDDNERYGGIAGFCSQSNISNCLYLGNDIAAYAYFGSITGRNTGTLTRNFYLGATVAAVGRDYSSGPTDDYQACRAVCLDELPDGVDEADYLAYDGMYYIRAGLLFNGHNNEPILEQSQDLTKFEIRDRTLYKDGSWNTLCLPFSVSTFAGSPLEGATVKTLSSAEFANGTLTLNFGEDLTAIEAGKPYIVKWKTPDDPITNPVFTDVSITATEPTATVCDPVTFQGTFHPVSITDEDKAKLYLGRGNTLYYPAPTDAEKPVTIGAFRAYFQLNGITAGEPADPSAGVRAFNLNFGDEETGITTTDFTDSTDKSAAWYDLNGRKLSGKPTQKGIYINNGKKVIIK